MIVRTELSPDLSHYGQYVAEREGRCVIEGDWGFCNYVIDKTNLYICEVFLAEGFRSLKIFRGIGEMLREIGRAQGCTTLTASVDPTLPSSTRIMKSHLAWGMKLQRCTERLVFLAMEV